MSLIIQKKIKKFLLFFHILDYDKNMEFLHNIAPLFTAGIFFIGFLTLLGLVFNILLNPIKDNIQDLKVSQKDFKLSQDELKASQDELKASHKELKASHKELKASQDELKASNREVNAKLDQLLEAR